MPVLFFRFRFLRMEETGHHLLGHISDLHMVVLDKTIYDRHTQISYGLGETGES